MKVAVFGCLHGMVNEMYNCVEKYENSRGEKLDFIIVCGDCQTVRHIDDLKCLAAPSKFKKLGDFHEYYSGKKKIPKLTIFVGGNHEASNYLMTLPYGGWVCDNFYYLGYAGVIRYKGLRIAGVSGIYNYHNCSRGRYERMPLNDQTMRSIYHTRRLDIFRLQLLSKNSDHKDPIDVFLSHDWPARIYDYGDKEQLLRFKPAFRADVESKEGLGSPLTQPLVYQLKPKKWFAAHLHCRFYAKIPHDANKSRCTEFLSLNKIENRRNFMEILDLPITREHDISDQDLHYDPEWLTILRKTIKLESDSSNIVACPSLEDGLGSSCVPTSEEIQDTIDLMNRSGGLKIIRNFEMTEPVIYNRPSGVQPSLDRNRTKFYPNHQTERLTSRLDLKSSNTKQTQEPIIKSEQTEVKVRNDHGSGMKPFVKVDPIIKTEPGIKSESGLDSSPPAKKRPLKLDEDGCLPFYIDTKGDK